jgi:hypothetical protein
MRFIYKTKKARKSPLNNLPQTDLAETASASGPDSSAKSGPDRIL